jgi:hypothetical protein
MTAQPARKVSDLNEERLLRDMAALQAAEAKVRDLRAKVQAGCREWSFAHGYRVILSPEQVRTAMERETS